MFKNVGTNGFEWGNLLCKTGIFLSFEFYSQKWARGTEKIALNLYFILISTLMYQLFTGC
jgi:hypothetical protein